MEVFATTHNGQTATSEREGTCRETVIILPRHNANSKSHFYCLTSEGPKALYDQDIFEQLMSEEEILVAYTKGDIWAYPCMDNVPVASRIEGRVRRLVSARTRQLIKSARGNS